MYEHITYEALLERMLENVSGRMDKREGSVVYDALSPAAIEMQILYLELDNILNEVYGDTATREYLIRRAAERGITPHSATCAVLKGVFVPADIDVTGRRFNIQDMNYVVKEQIMPGEYAVQCETEGAAGNRYLGSMTPIDYIAGLSLATLEEVLIPGKDEEDTEELRKRYFASFGEQSFGGNRADYIEKVRELDGVGDVKVTRAWNEDIRPLEMIPTEKVVTWYEKVCDGLDDEVRAWLETVYHAAACKKLTTGGTVQLSIINSMDYSAASDSLLRTVQELIDPEASAGEGYGLAPIGHVVNVASAEAVEISIATRLTFSGGYDWEQLQKAIENAVGEYLLALRKEWSQSDQLIVRVSQIENRILGVKGVIDIAGTLLNGISGNLTLSKYQIPVLGGVVHDKGD